MAIPVLVASRSPKQATVHGALLLANVFFGTGAVIGALGLPSTHPLVFALLREIGAGVILLIISIIHYGTDKSIRNVLSGYKVHTKSLSLLGLAVFGNQAAFIVGIKLAGPVTASVWQPSQPIITAAICMAWAWEPVRKFRLVGIVVATVGCITMALLKVKPHSMVVATTNNAEVSIDSNTTRSDGMSMATRHVLGNVLFFMNCLCTSLYVILSKRVLALHPPLVVTAWAYHIASVFMFVATVVATNLPGADLFFCPECPAISTNPVQRVFHIPTEAIPALLYYIIFASVGSYGLITWANQHATGTLIMSYTVLQPVTSSLWTILLLMFGMVNSCALEKVHEKACLDYPNWGTACGIIGVIVGLAMIISTEPSLRPTSGQSRYETQHYFWFRKSRCRSSASQTVRTFLI